MDREPSEAPTFTDSQYEEAYFAFMEGIVLRDIDLLRSGMNVLENSEFPLIGSVKRKGFNLERMLCDSDAEDMTGQIDDTFTEVARSYIYSGLYIKPDLLVFCAQMLEFTKEELRPIVYPARNLLDVLDRTDATREEHESLLYYRRKALIALGLGSTSLRLAQMFGRVW